MSIEDLLEDNVVVKRKTRSFDTEVGAGLFILLCLGVDEYRGDSNRYAYEFPKRKGKKYNVDILDIGE